MPTLIPEILESIFSDTLTAAALKPQYHCRSSCFNEKDETYCFIENFMLSGKKPMEIAINWFSQIRKIEISSGFCYFNNIFGFSFISPLLKPIMKAAGTSVKSILFQQSPGEEYNDVVLDAVINEGLLRVILYEKLPEKYMIRLRKMASIRETQLNFCMSFDDLFLIRSGTDIRVEMPFQELIRPNARRITRRYIRKLKLVGDSVYADITLATIKQYLIRVNEIFPDLQELEIFIRSDTPNADAGESAIAKWKDIIQMIKNLSSDDLRHIAPNVQKNFNFFLKVKDIKEALVEAGNFLKYNSEQNGYDKRIIVEKLDFHFHLEEYYTFPYISSPAEDYDY